MNFSFMDDPRWLQIEDDVTKQAMFEAAFNQDIASDPRWNDLSPTEQTSMRETYLREAQAYDEYVTAPETRGTLGRAASAAARGAVGAVESAGHAISLLTPAEETGRAVSEWAQETVEETPFLRPDKSQVAGEMGFVERGIYGGIESIPQTASIWGLAGAGALTGGALLGPPGAAIGAGVGGITGLIALFGAGTYGKEYQAVNEELARTRPDLSPAERKEIAHRVALGSSAFEVGTELPENVAALFTLGGSKALTTPIKATLRNIGKKPLKQLLKGTGQQAIVQTTGEMVAGGGQAWMRQREDLEGPTILEGVTESIIPALTMSLFFGAGAAGLNKVQTDRLKRDLNHTDADRRKAAVLAVGQRIASNTKDSELAKNWTRTALELVNEGAPFDFDQRMVDFAQVKMAEDVDADPEVATTAPGLEDTTALLQAATVDDAIAEFEKLTSIPPSAEDAAQSLVSEDDYIGSEVRNVFANLGIPFPELAGKDPLDFVAAIEIAQADEIRAEMEARAKTDLGPYDRVRQAAEAAQLAMTEREGIPVEPTGEPSAGMGSRFAHVVTEATGEGLDWMRGMFTTPEEIEARANEAATSPENELKEPTQAQKEAGNYKKGHITLWGMPISIENPRGSTRSGTAPDGTEWETEMQHHYGYFKRTEGKDGDQIDVFIGPHVGSNVAFIVDQVDPDSGKFDEHKTLLGFRDIDEAREGYLANYDEGWQGLGNITEVSIDEFKGWIGDGTRKAGPYAGEIRGDQRRPLPEEIEAVEGEEPEIEGAPESEEAPTPELQDTGGEDIQQPEEAGTGARDEIERLVDELSDRYDLEYIDESNNVWTFRRFLEDDVDTTVSLREPPTLEGIVAAIENQDRERREWQEKYGKKRPERRVDADKRARIDQMLSEILREELGDEAAIEDLKERLIELEGKERRALIDQLEEATQYETASPEQIGALSELAGERIAGEPEPSLRDLRRDLDSSFTDNRGDIEGIQYAMVLGDDYTWNFRRDGVLIDDDAWFEDIDDAIDAAVEDARRVLESRRQKPLEFTKREEAEPEPVAATELEGEIRPEEEPARDIEAELAEATDEDIDNILDSVFGEEPEAPADAEDAWRNVLTGEGRYQVLRAAGYTDPDAARISKTLWAHIPDETRARITPYLLGEESVPTEKPERTGAEIATEAGIEALEGVKEAVKGLSALFSPKNTATMGLAFDEDTYAAARPHFEAAWAHAKQAGYNLQELAQYLADQFDAAIRPYLKRYLQDQRDQKTPEEETTGGAEIPMEIIAGKHTKKGHDIWTVTLGERVDREVFVDLRARAKDLGGYYSNYRGGGAIPGFIFTDEASAQEFAGQSEAAAEKTMAEKSAELSDWVVRRLDQAVPIPWKELFRNADEIYGGTQAEGVYTPKDAYDALEMGVNKYIEKTRVADTEFQFWDIKTDDPVDAKHTIDSLGKVILGKIPTQTKRTDEQDQFQQFSTPPPLAYAVNWVANIREGESYLEPSAGIGGLAIFGKMAGADTVVNELSERRADLLDQMGFDRVYRENAEQLNNILPDDVRPSVIVMNPPFSATAGRVSKTKTMYGARHIEQALARLADGGRLVAIVGRGMAMDRPTFKKWWDRIQNKYNVRANVGVSGEEYRKYGTTFDNQILVIDKTGETRDNIVTGFAEKVSDIPELLNEVRNARTYQQPEQPTDQPPLQEPVEEAERPDTGTQTAPPTAPGIGPGEEPGEGGLETGGTIPVTGESDDSGESPGNDYGASTFVPDTRDPETDDRESVTDRGNSGPRGPISGELALEEKPSELAEGELTDSLYEPYVAPVKVEGAQPHPTPLVESAAMAAIQPPPINYVPNLPKTPIKKGNLSDIQLSAIAQAGEAHEKVLPDGKRKGFFIGDGTGVGKGREIGGIIWDNWRRGRRKAVWISENFDLLKDAKRDLSKSMGIGWDEGEDHIFGLNKTKVGKRIKKKEGILFASYHTVRGSGQSSYSKARMDQPDTLTDNNIRINQVVNWLGQDFDGVIAFDESHNMANAAPERGERGTKPPSDMALAGLMLQERLPNARVVYVSATGATEVRNLIYASRLGLWGPGTEFRDESRFVSHISSGGVAAMELVASNLKAMGLYTARSLSYDDVQYDRITHNLTDSQRRKYDELASAWQIVLQNIEEAVELTGSGKRGANMSQFWGAQQRFFNQIISTMQMPSAVKHMKEMLDEGNAVVIQLVNTDEAQQERALARQEVGQELEDLDLTPREALIGYLENGFPVQEWEEYEDDFGNIVKRPVYDSEGNPVLNAEAVQMRDELITRVAAIKMPNGPLDYLLEEFGADKIAEVTGRSRRIVTDFESGKKKIENRSSKAVEADVSAFMDDEKQILVFSGAGATGRSFHADLRVKNQRKRFHYLLQPGWRADRAVQGMGRSHRSNQKQAPEFFLVQTDLNGQKRFISSIARRLDQLGALTKGQRQTGSQGIFQAQDNLESSYANEALSSFIQDIVWGRVEEVPLDKFERQTGLKLTGEAGIIIPHIRQFLNRLLSMNIEFQNTVFDNFADTLDLVLDGHQMAGTLDVGIETIRGDKVEKKGDETVYSDPETGASTQYKIVDVTHPNKNKVSFEDSQQSFGNNNDGYFQNLKSKRVWVASKPRTRTDTTGELKTERVLMAPSLRVQKLGTERVDDENYWKKLTDAEAAGLWEAEHSKLPDTVTERHHIITGALLPVWRKIKGSPRIYRLQTDAGEKMIGRVVHPDFLKQTLEELGAASTAAPPMVASPDDVHTSILENDARYKLYEGWELKRAKVSGENRIEIKNVDYDDYHVMKDAGVIVERINYATRYFIPVSEEGVEVMRKVLYLQPVVSVQGAGARLSRAQYSVIPGEGNIKAQDLHEIFRGQTVGLSPQGHAWIRTKKGSGVSIQLVDHIDENNVALEIGYGWLSELQKPRGKYEAGTIYLQRDMADKWTLAHESMHWMEDVGILSPLEVEALKAHIRSQVKKGSRVTLNQADIGGAEDRAQFIADQLKKRKQAGPIGRIIQKIADFIDGLVNLVRRTARGVTREIESGKIFERPGERAPTSGPQFAVSQIAGSDVIKKIFSERPSAREAISEYFETARTREGRGVARDRMIAKTLDKLHFIKQRLGDRAYKAHRALTGIKSASFAMLLEHGKLKWVGDALSSSERNKGVLPFLKAIGPDWKNLLYYVAAKRSEYLARPTPAFPEGRENLITQEDRDAIFQMVGDRSKRGQRWEDLNKQLQGFNRNILDIAEEAGLIDPDGRAMWEQDYYIPFYRIFENQATKQEFLSGPKKSLQHITSQIRQLRGGTSQIGDPVENILKNWMYLLDAAARNKARGLAFDAGVDMGIIEEVPKKDLINVLGSKTIHRWAVIKQGNQRASYVAYSPDEARDYISQKLENFSGPEKNRPKYGIEKRKETLVKFGNMKDLGVLSFQREGKPIYFRTDDVDLYNSLLETNLDMFNNFIMRWMGKAKRALSYSATFGPAFRIRNMIRDSVHTSIINKDFKPFIDTARGFLKAMREDQDYIEYMASGFGFGSSYIDSADPQAGARFINRIIKREGKDAANRVLDTSRKLLNVWEKIGSASENAARVALYTNLKGKGFSNFDAGFEARDLMDFSMSGGGTSTQVLIRTIPFLNARVQAFYKLGRAAKQDPASFAIRSALLTVASLALWSLFKDDERYKELEDWDKWTYYHFWLGDLHYRIPKPFEIGAMFSSLPETVANVTNGTEEGKEVWDWFKFTMMDILRVDMPQMFKPMVEVGFNKSMFTGRAIVPEHMTKLKTSEQYQPWTSETARMIGEAINQSPLKIQHLVRGYFATIGMNVLSALDIFSREIMGYPDQPSKTVDDYGLGFVKRDRPARSSKYVTDFYDLVRDMDSLNRTVNHYRRTGQHKKAEDILGDERKMKLLQSRKQFNRISKRLRQINNKIKMVYVSRMRPEKKRQEIDRLTSARNQLLDRIRKQGGL